MPEFFDLRLPLLNGETFQHTIKLGEVLFALGANGTGKSSLITRVHSANLDHAKRISAHRQMWFASNALDITPSYRNSIENDIRAYDRQEYSRHREEYAAQRASLAIFDLIDADTMLARRIAELVRIKDMEAAAQEAEVPPPITIINQLMRSSNIPIEIQVEDQQKVVARKNNGIPYSVAELSDGERNAFLIAANVLNAKPGTLLLIDEPERHLHRSIVSPLLTLLFQKRTDCAFLISTHELMLPVDNPNSSTLLIRSCQYKGSSAQSWEVDLMPASAPFDEDLKIDILGGRHKMLFIEGTAKSLDAPLYSLLFPQVSIVPKSSCRDVEHAVRGLRDAEANHWVKAWGIVDNDQRNDQDIERLKTFGVFALEHFSVESLYYHPEMIRRVAAKIAEITGVDPEVLFNSASSSAISEAEKQENHFVLGAVERLARRQIFSNLPRKSEFKDTSSIKIEIDIAALKSEEQREFRQLIDTKDWEAMLARYPLRESGALNSIAAMIGFKTRADYENAVRNLLQKDTDALTFMRSLFKEIASEILPQEDYGDVRGPNIEAA